MDAYDKVLHMRRIAAISLLLAASCSPQKEETRNPAVDINMAAAQAQSSVDAYANHTAADDDTAIPAPSASASPVVSSVEPLTPPAPGTPGGLPDDRTPMSEAPFTPESAQGGANVVQAYYALLEKGKYREAWAMWDHDGKASGMSAPDFAASFARYSEYHANVGAPGEIDAGAGQRYVTVPVQIYGRLKRGGEPVYMLGSLTLHRTGDIDGATPRQKIWRIYSADIKPQPKADLKTEAAR